MSVDSLPPFAPLIASLVDHQMPTLSDTELRVLLVVLRQTAGRGKVRDWLARSQLVARTGRSPDAVSRAVEALVQRDLVAVEDVAGRSCDTPDARRAEQGPLYFRPGRALVAMATPISRPPNLDNPSTTNPRVTTHDTTGNNTKQPVEAYGKTQPVAPLWLQTGPQPTPEESERIEREKARIRDTLRRQMGKPSTNRDRATPYP